MDFFTRKTTALDSGLLSGAADRHSHILWGIDDGVKTSAETLEILSFLGECGLGDLWLTPHTAEDVPNTTERLTARFAELESLYTGPVRLHLASEYMLDTLYEQHLENKDFLTMEGDTVLVETSTWNPPIGLSGLLKDTMSAGYRPLLAHPERYRYMEMADYERLVAMGVRLQLNLPSLFGLYGTTAMEKAERLLKAGMYACWGSDCHRGASLRHLYLDKKIKKQVLEKVRQINNTSIDAIPFQ